MHIGHELNRTKASLDARVNWVTHSYTGSVAKHKGNFSPFGRIERKPATGWKLRNANKGRARICRSVKAVISEPQGYITEVSNLRARFADSREIRTHGGGDRRCMAFVGRRNLYSGAGNGTFGSEVAGNG